MTTRLPKNNRQVSIYKVQAQPRLSRRYTYNLHLHYIRIETTLIILQSEIELWENIATFYQHRYVKFLRRIFSNEPIRLLVGGDETYACSISEVRQSASFSIHLKQETARRKTSYLSEECYANFRLKQAILFNFQCHITLYQNERNCSHSSWPVR